MLASDRRPGNDGNSRTNPAVAVRSPERRFQIERGEYDTEKKEGAEHLVEQQRVLSEPSQTGVFRQHSLLDGPVST